MATARECPGDFVVSFAPFSAWEKVGDDGLAARVFMILTGSTHLE